MILSTLKDNKWIVALLAGAVATAGVVAYVTQRQAAVREGERGLDGDDDDVEEEEYCGELLLLFYRQQLPELFDSTLDLPLPFETEKEVYLVLIETCKLSLGGDIKQYYDFMEEFFGTLQDLIESGKWDYGRVVFSLAQIVKLADTFGQFEFVAEGNRIISEEFAKLGREVDSLLARLDSAEGLLMEHKYSETESMLGSVMNFTENLHLKHVIIKIQDKLSPQQIEQCVTMRARALMCLVTIAARTNSDSHSPAATQIKHKLVDLFAKFPGNPAVQEFSQIVQHPEFVSIMAQPVLFQRPPIPATADLSTMFGGSYMMGKVPGSFSPF